MVGVVKRSNPCLSRSQNRKAEAIAHNTLLRPLQRPPAHHGVTPEGPDNNIRMNDAIVLGARRCFDGRMMGEVQSLRDEGQSGKIAY
jgi:hypothetical protein